MRTKVKQKNKISDNPYAKSDKNGTKISNKKPCVRIISSCVIRTSIHKTMFTYCYTQHTQDSSCPGCVTLQSTVTRQHLDNSTDILILTLNVKTTSDDLLLLQVIHIIHRRHHHHDAWATPKDTQSTESDPQKLYMRHTPE
jgi:hypothetical protein